MKDFINIIWEVYKIHCTFIFTVIVICKILGVPVKIKLRKKEINI